MNLPSLAYRSLLRRRTRTALTLLGVAAASGSLFAVLSFDVGYKRSLKQEMADSGIHMFVSTEGCPMEAASLALHGGEIPKFLPEERVPIIRSVPGVKNMARFLIFSVTTPDGRTDLFNGVDDGILELKPHWKLQGAWFKDSTSIVLGAEAAKVEKRGVGDKIYFDQVDAEFTVSGILERTGSEDDGFFFIPLKTAQRLFRKPEKLTGVGVSLTDVERLPDVKARLERIPDVYVVTAQQMMEAILALIGSSKTLMFAVLVIVLLVSVLGVLNTVLMSVFETMPEFGYMRCVGASRGQILSLVLLETLGLCLVGSVVGAAAAAVFSDAADQFFRGVLPYAPAGKMVAPEPHLFFIAVLVAAAVGVAAGLYPAWRAANASPMEAIRNG